MGLGICFFTVSQWRLPASVSLPGVERSVAERMVERGHFICPYSNAIKGNVHVVTILE